MGGNGSRDDSPQVPTGRLSRIAGSDGVRAGSPFPWKQTALDMCFTTVPVPVPIPMPVPVPMPK